MVVLHVLTVTVGQALKGLLVGYKSLKAANGLRSFPKVLEGMVKNMWYMQRLHNHINHKLLEVARTGAKEIEVIEIIQIDDEDVSMVPQTRSMVEMKEFMRTGLAPLPSKATPAVKRSGELFPAGVSG
jgi:hypothetical protein